MQIDISTIHAQLLLISCQMQPTHCPQHTRPWPEANPSTMLQSSSHSWGAVMEGLSEWCLAGRWRAVPSAFPKALWGSLLVSQEWGHECRQTRQPLPKFVVALRTGNSLDNCSERCGQGTTGGQRLKSKKSFPPQSDPYPFCGTQGTHLISDLNCASFSQED